MVRVLYVDHPTVLRILISHSGPLYNISMEVENMATEWGGPPEEQGRQEEYTQDKHAFVVGFLLGLGAGVVFTLVVTLVLYFTLRP
jgi:hypothetical protein